MGFKEVLNLLFAQAKERHGVRNQQEFADRHGITREHMNQFLTGNLIPPAKTIWQILELEGYRLADCVFLPDIEDSVSKKHQAVTGRLHELLELEGPIAEMATVAIDAWHKHAATQQAQQKEGSLAPRERKKPQRNKQAGLRSAS